MPPLPRACHVSSHKVVDQGRKKGTGVRCPLTEHGSTPGRGHSLGKAGHRCPPASLVRRCRRRPQGCRPPRWRRRSSRYSSGPTSRWDTAGRSPDPATLRRGTGLSPLQVQHGCLPRPHLSHYFPGQGWSTRSGSTRNHTHPLWGPAGDREPGN